MPDSSILRHTPALSGSFDASRYAGQTLFTYNANPVTMDGSAGRFDDLLDFLHGYGSRAGHDLGALLNSELSASGIVTPGINSDDRFTLHYSAGSMGTDAVHATPGLGYKTNQNNDALNNLAGESEWSRGLFEFSTAEGLALRVPDQHLLTGFAQATRQSLPVWLAARTKTTTLEDALPAGSTAFVHPTGQVSIEIVGNVEIPAVSTWTTLGRALWSQLGGDGSETSQRQVRSGVTTDRYRITTAGPAHCFLACDRSYVEFRRTTEGRADHVILADGSVSSASLPPVQGWQLTLRVPGPAMGPNASRERHLREFWKHASHKLTFFPQWGDKTQPETGSMETRRHVDAVDALEGVGYSSTVTMEADTAGAHYQKRKGGRLPLRRHPSDEQTRVEDYGGQAVDVFQDIKIRVLDDPTR